MVYPEISRCDSFSPFTYLCVLCILFEDEGSDNKSLVRRHSDRKANIINPHHPSSTNYQFMTNIILSNSELVLLVSILYLCLLSPVLKILVCNDTNIITH